MAIELPFPTEQPGGQAVRRLLTFAQQSAPPIATALAYVLAAKAGAWLAFPSAPVSALWAPNAILLAALLLTRRERWWIYLLTVLPFHFLVQLPDTPLDRVAIQYAANAAEAVLGAWAIVQLCPHPRRFDRLRTVLVLILFAGVIAPLVTSLLMVLAFSLAGITADFWLTVIVRTPISSAIARSERRLGRRGEGARRRPRGDSARSALATNGRGGLRLPGELRFGRLLVRHLRGGRTGAIGHQMDGRAGRRGRRDGDREQDAHA